MILRSGKYKNVRVALVSKRAATEPREIVDGPLDGIHPGRCRALFGHGLLLRRCDERDTRHSRRGDRL